MSKDMNIIHKLLDGEASQNQNKEFLTVIDSDPFLRCEFNNIKHAINTIENIERLAAPSSFTSDVMRKLPERRKSYLRALMGFLFKGRALQWNVAAAATAAFLILAIFGGILQLQKMRNPAGVPAESVITVRINFYAPEAKTVAVAGDFNKWEADSGIMKKQDNGVWIIEIPLTPGTYSYMFVVDGVTWTADPNADLYRDDGFGYKNSVLKVSGV